MEKLITVKDVKARYGCCTQTARKYIRQCTPHMENPLAAPEVAFREWEEKRTVVMPESVTKDNYEEILSRIRGGARLIVPRRR